MSGDGGSRLGVPITRLIMPRDLHSQWVWGLNPRDHAPVPATRFSSRARWEPRYGRVADVVAPADLRQRLAGLPPRNRLLPLMCRELQLAAELDASSLWSLAAFVSPRLDQLPFKLRKPTQHGQHQSPVGSRGIGPSIGQRSKPRTSFGNRIEHIEQITRGPCEPIEASDE